MDKNARQDFLLGLVTLVLIALLVGTIIFVFPGLDYETRPITVHFAHDQGLAPLEAGSPILLGGALQVGKVDALHLVERDADPEKPGPELYVAISGQLKKDITLYKDAAIYTGQPTVGGVGYVVIGNVGTPAAGEYEGGVIRGAPPKSLQATVAQLSTWLTGPGGLLEKIDAIIDPQQKRSLTYKLLAVLDDVKDMTQRLKGELDPQERQAILGKVHAVMDDITTVSEALRTQMDADEPAAAAARVNAVLDTLQSALGEVEGMITDARPSVARTLSNVEDISRGVETDLLAPLARELDRQTPGTLLAKLHEGMDNVTTALENVEKISGTGRRMVVGNKPLIDKTVENLKQTSDTMRTGMQELLLQPWRLLQKPAAAQRERLQVFEAARRFAEAADHLDDAAARLEALREAAGAAPDPDARAEMARVREQLRLAFQRFEEAESYFFGQLKP